MFSDSETDEMFKQIKSMPGLFRLSFDVTVVPPPVRLDDLYFITTTK